jgi:hypothetical protein
LHLFDAVLVATAIRWLVNYCPGGVVYKMLDKWYIKVTAREPVSSPIKPEQFTAAAMQSKQNQDARQNVLSMRVLHHVICHKGNITGIYRTAAPQALTIWTVVAAVAAMPLQMFAAACTALMRAMLIVSRVRHAGQLAAAALLAGQHLSTTGLVDPAAVLLSLVDATQIWPVESICCMQCRPGFLRTCCCFLQVTVLRGFAVH